jgi:hypothetical protein
MNPQYYYDISIIDYTPFRTNANVVALEIFVRNNREKVIREGEEFQYKRKTLCRSPLSIVQTIVYTT